MIISINTEETFHKIQFCFPDKTPLNVSLEGAYRSIIKPMWKTDSQPHLTGKK